MGLPCYGMPFTERMGSSALSHRKRGKQSDGVRTEGVTALGNWGIRVFIVFSYGWE